MGTPHGGCCLQQRLNRQPPAKTSSAKPPGPAGCGMSARGARQEHARPRRRGSAPLVSATAAPG
eukprot:5501296-Pyramimonas_sp.AAC.1